jgi:crotonobetainyl-CoA:carnitine CoA-transferase CaiB-like acyl-CoA transferase
MSDFFKDFKVIELSSVLAGPSAGMFFAELGARVLKVENKRTGGDVTRGWRLSGESAEGVSAYYCSVNYGKEIWMLDLSDEADRKTILDEIATSDLVISNYQPHTAVKLGMDYTSLSALKKDLIYLQLDGFSESERPAFDVVLQAETGWISMTGTDPEQPSKLPVALIDIIAGHQLKEAALLAIIHRMRTGEGSYLRCNLEQASLTALANQATNYLMEGVVAQPIGTLHPNIAPYGDWFTTSDGRRVVLAIGSDAQFAAFCESTGISALAKDKRFSTNAARVVHRNELAQAIKPAIASESLQHWDELWSRHNIPFGEIKSLDKVLESRTAGALIREEIIEGKRTKRLSGNAFSASFLKP